MKLNIFSLELKLCGRHYRILGGASPILSTRTANSLSPYSSSSKRQSSFKNKVTSQKHTLAFML